MPATLTIVGRTDIGRVRRRNEDALALAPESGVAVVADGMGGHPGGDVASRIAADHARELLRSALAGQGSAVDLGDAMARAVSGAHLAIRARSELEPHLNGMGTTLTAFVTDSSTDAWAIGHVGDSRAYLLRQGTFRQLTRDDTWVQQRVDEAQLTPEQARRHPFGHILTQCVGLDEAPRPQLLEGRLEAGDVFLLCTDGLTGMTDDEVLADLLRAHLSGAGRLDAEGASRALVETALDRGGHDNVSLILIVVG